MDLTSLFTSVEKKQTHFRSADEIAGINALLTLFNVHAWNITDAITNRQYATSPLIIYKNGNASKRFGYDVPPKFLIGALLPVSQEHLLEEVIDVKCRRLEIPGAMIPSLLSNPTSVMDTNILALHGKRRSFRAPTEYFINFVSAPILGEIYETHGERGLRSILEPSP